MKYIKLFVTCLLVISLAGCGRPVVRESNDAPAVQGRVTPAALTLEDTDRWLASKNEPSNMNITGEWDSGGVWTGGWGVGRFIQQGRNFTGSLGLYNVEGVVSGNEIYMVIFSAGALYYTAILSKGEHGELFGKATYLTLADDVASRHAQFYMLSMKRVTR